MSIKPILFNTEMTKAILDGRKTVTRRVVKPSQMIGIAPDRCPNHTPEEFIKEKPLLFIPYCEMPDADLVQAIFKEPYQTSDILYVRETWFNDGSRYMYRANYSESEKFYRDGKEIAMKWKPSIHMPKEAARIWLKVTDVRVERLKEVTEEQAAKEGAIDNRGFIHSYDNEYDEIHTAREHFEKIWDSTIQKQDLDTYGWDANPWVWVIEFERCEKPEEDNA